MYRPGLASQRQPGRNASGHPTAKSGVNSMPRKAKLAASVSQAAASFAVSGGFMNLWAFRAGKTKHGPRPSGKRWDAQHALTEIFKGTDLPQKVSNWEYLTRRVNEILKRNPLYEEIDSMTVRRAFGELHRRS
jgi:hypothetical protein